MGDLNTTSFTENFDSEIPFIFVSDAKGVKSSNDARLARGGSVSVVLNLLCKGNVDRKDAAERRNREIANRGLIT